MRLPNFKNMETEINGYGYEYSIKKFIQHLLLSFILLVGAGLFYKLNMVFILITIIFVFFAMPIIILAQFRYLANNKKFETLVGYLEQMIFAFKKSPKILESFKTVLNVVDKNMKPYIEKAIMAIENDTTGDGYLKAFEIIESTYHCSRIKALHKFMLNVEENGGKYQRSIDILLDDIKTWVTTTYQCQAELKNIKSKIFLSVGLSLMIAGTMMIIIPTELIVFGDSMVYQISTCILFMILIALITFVQTRLNGKWFTDDTIHANPGVLESAKKTIDDYNTAGSRKKSIISFIITLPIACMGILIQNVFVIGCGLLVSLFMLNKRKLTYRSSKKKILRAIEKDFPIWLRDISLQLQTLIVPLAIKNSIPEASNVLQPHLAKLSKAIDENPNSIVPYNDFLKEYPLREISNAMKVLYTIQSLSVDDAQEQIDDLVKRNQTMLARSEEIRNEDMLMSIGFIVAIPMVASTLKLIVDLVLILAAFMSMSNGMM